jgi:hypothetical protein
MDKNLGDDTHETGIGTAGTSCVATEYGDGKNHVTRIVITDLAQTIGEDASLGVGALIYTFPAGIIAVKSAGGSVAMTIVFATKTDTPEVGLGTVIASGAIATLGAGAATMENITDGVATADVNGTAKVLDSNLGESTMVIPAASAHTVFLNWADAWIDATGEDNSTIQGTVWLDWTLLA